MPTEHYVVQRYLHKPYLVDKLKFDLRIYAMVCGVDPLRIYLYKEGLCRLATFEYMPPAQANLSNLYMHLTNYAINKTNENYLQADNLGEGHKRSLSYFFKYLDMQGHNSQSVLH